MIIKGREFLGAFIKLFEGPNGVDLYLLEETRDNRYCFAILCHCGREVQISGCLPCGRPAIKLSSREKKEALSYWKTRNLQEAYNVQRGVTVEDFIATWTGIPVEQLEVEIRETGLG